MDRIVKGLSNDHNIKITITDATNLLNEIIKLHETNPLATIALARTTMATILIGSDMKEESDKITSILNGKGPIGTIMAEYTGHKVRAFCANPQFSLEDIDRDHDVISQVVGTKGYLQVIKDLGMKEPFTGKIKLISGEINLDFTYYLVQSEQIKSLIACSVKLNKDNTIEKAVGLYAQLLPEHQEEDIDYLEGKVENLGSITEKLIESDDLKNIFHLIDPECKIYEPEEIKFSCSCSFEKALESVKLLGEEQINEVLENNSEVEIVCDFCRTKYLISSDDIKKLMVS
ncbi:Hsp33 family molecular chaperone HslO [Spiroplasma chrysopicola]|uniref:Heat shock protein 33 n=1 Tax=Spiroplasma chrysopicola DF-1 TaxID=1276227 RepID=R4UGZ5_9MOLU|nr:Hsp33 family molecular chaperone HslO [Spiroplasma chrysopicola]AGM24601.1 heat shock protein 33 [Spiroplasma chrysopicola DF-1]